MKTKEVVITEFFNLTKVMNELTKGAVRIAGNSDPCSGGVDISVGTSTKPARVWVKLSCKPDDKELIGQALTFFDRDIIGFYLQPLSRWRRRCDPCNGCSFLFRRF